MKLQESTKKYIGIGICCVGVLFLCKALLRQPIEEVQEPMVGMLPLKAGTEILMPQEDTQEDIDVFSIATNNITEVQNPLWAESDYEQMLVELIFEPLARRDANGDMYPILAERIVYSEDGLQMKITIRDDILFSDGTSLDIYDVEESLLLSLLVGGIGTENIEGTDAFLFQTENGASGIEVVDETTLIISFEKYDFTNQLILETPIQKVVPLVWNDPEIVSDAQLLLGAGIGTNAYMLLEEVEGATALMANPYYKNETKLIDLVVLYDIRAFNTTDMVNEQQIDYYAFSIDTQLYDTIVDKETLDIYGKDSALVMGLMANDESEVAMDPTVRGLLRTVIDRNDMFSDELQYKIQPETSILPKMVAKLESPEDTMNHQMALSHMSVIDELIQLRIPILQGNAIHLQMGEKLKDQLAPYNVKVELDVVSEFEYMELLYITKAYDFHFAELPEQMTIFDIDTFLYSYGIDIDAAIIDVVTRLSDGQTLEERDALYEKVQTFYQNNTRFIALGRVQDLTAVSTSYRGYVMTMETKVPLYIANMETVVPDEVEMIETEITE